MQEDVEEMQIDQEGDEAVGGVRGKSITIKKWNQETKAVRNAFTFFFCLFLID